LNKDLAELAHMTGGRFHVYDGQSCFSNDGNGGLCLLWCGRSLIIILVIVVVAVFVAVVVAVVVVVGDLFVACLRFSRIGPFYCRQDFFH
jgi:hypothetical protein